jgi:hypothetical protein
MQHRGFREVEPQGLCFWPAARLGLIEVARFEICGSVSV